MPSFTLTLGCYDILSFLHNEDKDRPGQARTGIYTIDLVKFKLQHSKIDFVFALVQLFSPQIFFSMAHCALLILQFDLPANCYRIGVFFFFSFFSFFKLLFISH